MYSAIVVTSPPTSEPVSLEDVKDALRLPLDYTHEDIYLTGLITSAREQAERYCNRFFAECSARLTFVDSRVMRLPPDSTITSITVNGETITDYSFDTDTLILTTPTYYENIKVEILTGKSYTLANRAIIMLAADLYDNKTERNFAAENMLYRLRVNMGI